MELTVEQFFETREEPEYNPYERLSKPKVTNSTNKRFNPKSNGYRVIGKRHDKYIEYLKQNKEFKNTRDMLQELDEANNSNTQQLLYQAKTFLIRQGYKYQEIRSDGDKRQLVWRVI